ncbi:hypothetical protein VPH35_033197 [Triticum aestivum]
MPANVVPDARNLFDEMPDAGDEDYMQNLIFEGSAPAAGYDPDETKRQDGRGAFTPGAGYDQSAFMRDQVGMDLDGFLLDHKFPDDYGQEEEDECDIELEPLFEDELANRRAEAEAQEQAHEGIHGGRGQVSLRVLEGHWTRPRTGAEQKHSTFWIRVHREFHERKKFPPYQIVSTRGWVSISKRWRVIQQECNKFCATLESVKTRPVGSIGMQDMAVQALEAFKVQHNGKCFNLSHCYRVIKDEEKFKAQYATLRSRVGKEAVEDIGDGEPARPRGNTNSKKEDKQDAASNALIASVEGMMNKKDSREEERRRFKEEQMNSFMKIQRRRLEMDAEKQAKMLELEAEKQAKMLEIEAANAKTKAKEVALASMMTGVEIMKVALNTMSRRKRPWYEKMQADMLKFTDE